MRQNVSVSSKCVTQKKELHHAAHQIDLKSRLLQGCSHGWLGEVAAELLSPMDIRDTDACNQVTFSTPFGIRRLDNYHPQTREATDSRNAREVANQLTRDKVRKDAYLLKSGQLSRVTWLLFLGASPRLLELLDQHGIRHVEGWEALLVAGRAKIPGMHVDGIS